MVLRNPATVGLGLASYSLYLIHWPMIVFYRYYKFGGLSVWEKWEIIGASITAALLMYRFVERPFRRRRGVPATHYAPPAWFAACCIVLALMLATPALGAWTNGGWVWRLPAEIRSTGADLRAKAEETGRFIGEGWQPFEESGRRVNVLIIGDSHSIDFFNAVYTNRQAFKSYEFRRLDLQPFCFYLFTPGTQPVADEPEERNEACRRNFASFKISPLLNRADYVIISGAWSKYALGFIPDLKKYLDSRGINLIMLGRTPDFDPDIPSVVVKWGRLYGIGHQVARHRRLEVDELNKVVEDVARKVGARYKDKLFLVCDVERESCDALDSQNRLTYHDADHWTLEGARHFGRKMAEVDYFAEIIPVTQKQR